MNKDAAKVELNCKFWSVAKFEGDGPPKTGLSDLESLQADLTNPKCFELIVGGDGLPTQVWRK